MLSWGRALGPLGGLSTGQLSCCLPRMEEKRREERNLTLTAGHKLLCAEEEQEIWEPYYPEEPSPITCGFYDTSAEGRFWLTMVREIYSMSYIYLRKGGYFCLALLLDLSGGLLNKL